MKTLLFIISAFVFYSPVLYAGEGSIFSILRIPAGAAASSAGNAAAAVSGNPQAIFINPAALSGSQDYSLSTTQALWIESMHYGNYAVAGPLFNGYFGLGVVRFSAGAIRRYDYQGLPVSGTYNPTDLSVTAGYSGDLNRISLGAAVKYLSSDIAGYTASALAADAGVLFRTEVVDLGIAVQNLGTQVSYRDFKESLPVIYRGGVSRKIRINNSALLFSAAAELLENLPMRYGGGARLELSPGEAVLSLSLGFQSDTAGRGPLAPLTWGVGLRDENIGFDYAAAYYGELGMAHRVTVNYRIASPGSGGLF